MFRLFDRMYAYDRERNLSSNFFVVCSLFWVKQDSAATIKLKDILEKCHFTADDNITGLDYETRSQKRNQQIAKLETVKLAIREWHIECDKFSSRVELVNEFEREVENHQRSLYMDNWYDHHDSKPQDLDSVDSENTQWNNEVEFEKYLPEETRHIFQRLQSLPPVSSARKCHRGSL